MEDFFGNVAKEEFKNVAVRMRKSDYGIVVNLAIQTRKDLVDLADRLDSPQMKQLGYSKTMKVEFNSLKSLRDPIGGL